MRWASEKLSRSLSSLRQSVSLIQVNFFGGVNVAVLPKVNRVASCEMKCARVSLRRLINIVSWVLHWHLYHIRFVVIAGEPYPVVIKSSPEGMKPFDYTVMWETPNTGGMPITAYEFRYRKKVSRATSQTWGCEIWWCCFMRCLDIIYFYINLCHTTLGRMLTISFRYKNINP